MPLAGELERYLRVVRVRVDALGESFDDALANSGVPVELRDQLRARWEEEHTQVIRPARMLARGGPKEWSAAWDPAQGYYWRRLRAFLIDHIGRADTDVRSLDDSSDRILKQLEDPRESGPERFRVQGLVVGYIQSGKTANFSALIAKAADLGYKFVLVLSGIHNSLRQQTQRRLAQELGLSPAGVGEPVYGRRWVSLTTPDLNGDFRAGTVDANILQGTNQVLAVVKKNATVLRRLIAWMADHAPQSLAVLIIDDEADQASINTRGNRPPLEEVADLRGDDLDGAGADEIDPSVINALVRRLIQSFGRVAYVAYTATPFANVLIGHRETDREFEEDLYPRDFIVSLPRLPGYVGAERLFGRDVLSGDEDEIDGLDIIRIVPDEDVADVIPAPGHGADFEPGMTESLRVALLDFLLATAARIYRDGDPPCSMLVHTHQRTAFQNSLAKLVDEHLATLRNSWRYDRETARPQFAQRWEAEFRPVTARLDLTRDVPFEAIEPELDRFLRNPVPVIVLNSTSDHILDYELDPTLKAVLVGGNRLSRGLTLEGLLVSYYVRESPYYDTLFQMGRWFGFRDGYVDLTRIWTTGELAGWFRDLALAEEELRRQIDRYEREHLTPLEFGVKIRAHPDMLVTAENKMGSAHLVSQNYAGSLIQTIIFRLEDPPWLERNLEATRRFLSGLGPPHEVVDGNFSWADIEWRSVERYLRDYRGDPRAARVELESMREYLVAQARQDELIRWRVSVRALGRPLHDDEDLGITNHNRVNTISRTRLIAAESSIGSLVNPSARNRPGVGDEEHGLTADQIAAARALAGPGVRYGEALRSQRDKSEGLLLVYPISRLSEPVGDHTRVRRRLFDDPERHGCTVVGIALVFPFSDSAATVEYVAGSVAAEEREVAI